MYTCISFIHLDEHVYNVQHKATTIELTGIIIKLYPNSGSGSRRLEPLGAIKLSQAVVRTEVR